MKEVFATYKEKFVKGAILYYKEADGILYYEPEFTTKVSKNRLVDLFKKGLVVIDDGTSLVRPTSCTESDDYASVAYITVGDANIAVLTSFYSEGYVAG